MLQPLVRGTLKKAEVQEKRRAQQQQQSLLDGNLHVLSYDENQMRLGS